MNTFHSFRLVDFVCKHCRHRWSRSRRGLASAASPSEIYDVVTVGGGPVGLALVAALSKVILSDAWPSNLTTGRIISHNQESQDSTD